MINFRWGKGGILDYWAALAAGEVDPPEQRAMTLLSSVCDSYRFSLYCMTGCLAAIGNLTRTVYLIRRRLMTFELDDGRPVASWCISIGPDANIPLTDNIVAIKALIEGEEGAFRRTGNRMEMFPGDTAVPPIPGVCDPVTQRFIDAEEPLEACLERVANRSMLDHGWDDRAAADVAIRMERSWETAVARQHNVSVPMPAMRNHGLYLPEAIRRPAEMLNEAVAEEDADTEALRQEIADAVRHEIEVMEPMPVYA